MCVLMQENADKIGLILHRCLISLKLYVANISCAEIEFDFSAIFDSIVVSKLILFFLRKFFFVFVIYLYDILPFKFGVSFYFTYYNLFYVHDRPGICLFRTTKAKRDTGFCARSSFTVSPLSYGSSFMCKILHNIG